MNGSGERVVEVIGMAHYEDIIIRLAKRVQSLRKRLGLTQAALASRAGVTVETVARLERVVRGRPSANSNPSLETLIRIASALEVGPHELLASEPVVQRKGHQLECLLDSASPASTRRILRVAEALLRDELVESGEPDAGTPSLNNPELAVPGRRSRV
ncbi:MAG TPA: helix-turn-helix transcriptional regulator [Polyangiaceae bacterium]|nr:helix-turn-helix transcriptional regulator [Polyangiaceae bacterium]